MITSACIFCRRKSSSILGMAIFCFLFSFAIPCTSIASFAPQSGKIEINHNWTRVDFETPFHQPVVVASVASDNGKDPCVIRIQDVETTGFSIRLQEYNYLNGPHAKETVNYMVVDKGTYLLENGKQVEAGTFSAPGTKFVTQPFESVFSERPVLLTAVASYNGSHPVTGRVRDITTDGFDYTLQEEQALTEGHAAETVHYIAWEPCAGVIDGLAYEVAHTADAITDKFSPVNYGTEFKNTPLVLADMQTFNGPNTAKVRSRNITPMGFDARIEEEQSEEEETTHTAEQIGFFVVAKQLAPIAHWTFDKADRSGTVVRDISGNGNHGTIHGGVNFTPGPRADAVEFNGQDGYITIADQNKMLSGMEQFTIGFWLRDMPIIGANPQKAIIHKGGVDGAYFFSTNPIGQYKREVQSQISCADGQDCPSATQALDRFFHYTFTYDGNFCRQFINGHMVKEERYSVDAIPVTPNDLILGQGIGDYTYFDGGLDELTIFDVALKPSQVMELYGGDCGFRAAQGCIDPTLSGSVIENDQLTAWSSSSLLKVLPDFRPPANRSELKIQLAKNETRFLQLALTPKVDAEKALAIATEVPSGLSMSLMLAEPIPIVEQPKSPRYLEFKGAIPDAVLPTSGSIQLKANQTMVIVVEVKAEPDVSPGSYVVGVKIGESIVPVKIEVYDFTVPDRLTLKTAFDSGHFGTRYNNDTGTCTGLSPLDFHGLTNADADRMALADAYWDSYAQHRLTPYKPHQYRPFSFDCETQTFDFTSADQALRTYLDERHMNSVMLKHFSKSVWEGGFPLCGLKVGSEEYENLAIQYYQGIEAHLRENGWLDLAYFGIDEPSSAYAEDTRKVAQIITQNTKLKIGPMFYKDEKFDALEGAVNLWIVNNNYNRTYSNNIDRVNEMAAAGDEVWWYYTSGRQFDIDGTAVDNIAHLWAAWKYEIRGVLNWSTIIYDFHCSERKKNSLVNPWTNPHSPWGNGQVTFFYPPCRSGVCDSPSYNVTPSWRLKQLREGIQDYEYFTLLASLIDRGKALSLPVNEAEATLARIDEVIWAPDRWSNQARLYAEIRGAVANQIMKLDKLLAQVR